MLWFGSANGGKIKFHRVEHQTVEHLKTWTQFIRILTPTQLKNVKLDDQKGCSMTKNQKFSMTIESFWPCSRKFWQKLKKIKSPLKKILLKLDTFSDAFWDTSVPVRVLFTVEKSLLKGRQYLTSKVTRADSHLVTIPWRDVRFRPRIWLGQIS